jgi:hypothetical protein
LHIRYRSIEEKLFSSLLSFLCFHTASVNFCRATSAPARRMFPHKRTRHSIVRHAPRGAKTKIFAPLAKSPTRGLFAWLVNRYAEAKIGVLIEGPLMRGVDVGELVGGKQGREIFSGLAASSPPPCGEG